MIAALGHDGRKEWEGLQAAVEKAEEIGLDIELLVLTGREDLLHEINNAVAGGQQHVAVRPLPASRVVQSIPSPKRHKIMRFGALRFS